MNLGFQRYVKHPMDKRETERPCWHMLSTMITFFSGKVTVMAIESLINPRTASVEMVQVMASLDVP